MGRGERGQAWAPTHIDMEMRMRGTVEHGKRRDERDIESTNVGVGRRC